MRKILSIAAIALTTVSILWGTQRLYVPAPTVPTMQAVTAEQLNKQFRSEAKTKEIHRQALIAHELFRKHHYNLTHADLIAKYAIEHHIPVRLLAAVVFVESKGNARAVYGGADFGLMQINIKTWKKYSVRQLMDPEFNLKVGSQILGTYIHLFGFVEGLHHYNGMNKADNSYAKSVYEIAGMQMPA
jgi:soluble lytic murein transglycosylase-like protein